MVMKVASNCQLGLGTDLAISIVWALSLTCFLLPNLLNTIWYAPPLLLASNASVPCTGLTVRVNQHASGSAELRCCLQALLR